MSANETVADIVAEKREMAAKICAELSQVPTRREDQLLEAESLEREADRIEAAWKRQWSMVGQAVLDFCNVFTLVYPPNDKDCPAVLAGAFEMFKEEMGIETVDCKGEGDGR